jgi:hypothetical protein
MDSFQRSTFTNKFSEPEVEMKKKLIIALIATIALTLCCTASASATTDKITTYTVKTTPWNQQISLPLTSTGSPGIFVDIIYLHGAGSTIKLRTENADGSIPRGYQGSMSIYETKDGGKTWQSEGGGRFVYSNTYTTYQVGKGMNGIKFRFGAYLHSNVIRVIII